MAPQATLVFKIFLSPLDPHASMLRSQLQLFFPCPLTVDNEMDNPFCRAQQAERAGKDVRVEDTWEEKFIGKQGYDMRGRRGGVWVRKPRSSRPGSAGESQPRLPHSTLTGAIMLMIITYRGLPRVS